MIVSDMKVGDEFYMDGLSFPDNNPVKTKCTLIEYRGMKIWSDESINLYPYGYPYAFSMNQLHQYILIFRKVD